MTDAKLISYTINDFSTEIEMESFLHLMEKHGDEFYKKLKKHGLIRWRVTKFGIKLEALPYPQFLNIGTKKLLKKVLKK